jgi:hypothetical protein
MASPDEGRCVSCGSLVKYAQSPDALHIDTYLEGNQPQRERGDLLMLPQYEVRDYWQSGRNLRITDPLRVS